MKKPQTVSLTARVTPELKTEFMCKANREPNKTPSDVLRDLVTSYLQQPVSKETSK